VKETGHPSGRDAVAVFKPADGKLSVVAHAQPNRCSRFRGLFQLKHGLPDGLVVHGQNGIILMMAMTDSTWLSDREVRNNASIGDRIFARFLANRVIRWPNFFRVAKIFS
jgi:hypothetical protein